MVSAVPSALFVLFVFGLVASGAWNGEPDWTAAGRRLAHISLGEASALVIATLALALILHPLQFALTQVMEGYWGLGVVPRTIAERRTMQHRRRYADAEDRWNSYSRILGSDEFGWGSDRNIEKYVPAFLGKEAVRRVRQSYPTNKQRFMPTRLGNMLRRYEDLAGSAYGLSALAIHPHLVLAAEPSRRAVLRDAREQLDLAVRLCGLSLLATIVACLFLLTDGLWLLLALAPFASAYLCYRGAIVAASNWGAVLAAVIDLERFRLYEALHIQLPGTLRDEVDQNERLMDALLGERRALVYQHPEPHPPSA